MYGIHRINCQPRIFFEIQIMLQCTDYGLDECFNVKLIRCFDNCVRVKADKFAAYVGSFSFIKK